MKTPRALAAIAAAGAIAAIVFARAANAQDWPNRPLTMVAPFGPGGSTDANQEELLRAVRMRKSVLDFASGELTRLKSLAPASASVRAALRYDAGRSVHVLCETPGLPALLRISAAFVVLNVSGVVVTEATDDTELASRQDGVTTQSMNCHTAATRVISSRTVATAWAMR